ncbi:MAG: ribosome recycling factor [Bacteroidota bacterium]
MIDDSLTLILDDARDQMRHSLEHLASELDTIRAGRASAAMLDSVRVEAYGTSMPLNQVASVSAPAADLIVVQPFDKSTLGDIERGITLANLGLNPTNDGTLIRIGIPALTEERRKELAKTAKSRTEDAKVSIRNVRKDAKNEIHKTVKDESLSEDMQYEADENLQKLTDEMSSRAEKMLVAKEKDIMTV